MGNGPETNDARFVAPLQTTSPTRHRQHQQQQHQYRRGTKTRKGFSTGLAKHGMFRDTTITASTRRREIAVMREHVEQKRLTEAQVRLERELERDEQELELSLKRQARKAKRERRRQKMQHQARAADLIQYHWLNCMQRKQQALAVAFAAAAIRIQAIVRRKSARRQYLARRWILRTKACRVIQQTYRSVVRSRHLHMLKNTITTRRLQAWWKIVHAKRSEKRKLVAGAAVRIQSRVRVRSARRKVKVVAQRRRKTQNRSAMEIEDNLSRLANVAAKRRIASSNSGFFLTQTSSIEHEEVNSGLVEETNSIETSKKNDRFAKSEKNPQHHNTFTNNDSSTVSESGSIVIPSISASSSTSSKPNRPNELVLSQIRKRREKHERELHKAQQEGKEKEEKQRLVKAADDERLRKVLAHAEKRRVKEKQLEIVKEKEAAIVAQQTEKEEMKRKEQARVVMQKMRQKRLDKALIQRAKEEEKEKLDAACAAQAKAKLDHAKADFLEKDKLRLEKIREAAKRRVDETREVHKRDEEAQLKAAEEKARVDLAKEAMRAQHEAVAKEKTQARLRLKRTQKAKADALLEQESNARKEEMKMKAAKLLHDTKLRLRSKTTASKREKARHNPLGLRAAVTGLANMRAAAKRRRHAGKKSPPVLGMLNRSNGSSRDGSPMMPDMSTLPRNREQHDTSQNAYDGHTDTGNFNESDYNDEGRNSKPFANSSRGTELCGTPLDEFPALLLPRLLPDRVAKWAAQNKSSSVSPETSAHSSPRTQLISFKNSKHAKQPQQRKKLGARAHRPSHKNNRNASGKTRASQLLQRALEWKRQQQKKDMRHSNLRDDDAFEREVAEKEAGSSSLVLMQADQELNKMGKRRPQIPSSLTIHGQHQPNNIDTNTKAKRKAKSSACQPHLPLVGGVLAVPKRSCVHTKKATSNVFKTLRSITKDSSHELSRENVSENEEGTEFGDGYSEDSFDDLDDMLEEEDGTSEKGPEYNGTNGDNCELMTNGFGDVQTIRPGSRRSEALLSLERDCAARMIQLSFLQYKHIKKSIQRRTRRGFSQAEELRVLRDE